MLPLRAALNSVLVALLTVMGSLLALVVRLTDSSGDRVVDLARLWSLSVTKVAGIKMVVESKGVLDPRQPYVFMANHESVVDIWALFIAVPQRIRMIAKKQLGQIPVFGWAMWAGRFIFIDRQNAASARRSIKVAEERIRGGDSVLMFPEGTRSRDGSLGEFKKGGFHLAIAAGVPVVPVAVRGARRIMPRGKLLLWPGTVVVTIGAPISTVAMTDVDRNALLERVRAEIAAMREATTTPTA